MLPEDVLSRPPRRKGARIVGEGSQRSSVRPYRQAGEGLRVGRWGWGLQIREWVREL